MAQSSDGPLDSGWYFEWRDSGETLLDWLSERFSWIVDENTDLEVRNQIADSINEMEWGFDAFQTIDNYFNYMKARFTDEPMEHMQMQLNYDEDMDEKKYWPYDSPKEWAENESRRKLANLGLVSDKVTYEDKVMGIFQKETVAIGLESEIERFEEDKRESLIDFSNYYTSLNLDLSPTYYEITQTWRGSPLSPLIPYKFYLDKHGLILPTYLRESGIDLYKFLDNGLEDNEESSSKTITIKIEFDDSSRFGATGVHFPSVNLEPMYEIPANLTFLGLFDKLGFLSKENFSSSFVIESDIPIVRVEDDADFLINYSFQTMINPNNEVAKLSLMQKVSDYFIDGDTAVLCTVAQESLGGFSKFARRYGLYRNREKMMQTKENLTSKRIEKLFNDWKDSKSLGYRTLNSLIKILGTLKERIRQDTTSTSILLAMSMATLLVFLSITDNPFSEYLIITSFLSGLCFLSSLILLYRCEVSIQNTEIGASKQLDSWVLVWPTTTYQQVRNASQVQHYIDRISYFGLFLFTLCLIIIPFSFLTPPFLFVMVSISLIMCGFVLRLFAVKFAQPNEELQKIRETELVWEFMDMKYDDIESSVLSQGREQ